MLDVVEQAEQRLARQVRCERLLERCARLFRDRERARERGEDERGIAKRRERHPVDAVGEGLGYLGRGLQGKAGLAGAAGAGEGEQARLLPRQEPDHLRQLCLAAEEGCRGDGEVRAVQALERGEVGLSELVDALGGGRGP